MSEELNRRLTPLEAVDELNLRIRYVMRSTVGLFGLSSDGRAIAKGAGVLINISGERFIFTAEHVAAGTIYAGLQTILCLFPLDSRLEAITSTFVVPEKVDISSCQVIWSDDSLDVAAISCPVLDSIAPERFIDGADDGLFTRKLRGLPPAELASPEGYIPFLVCGFPNLGEMTDFAARCQIVSGVPFIAEVSSWDNWHWAPGEKAVPQCHLDLSNIDDSPVVPGLNFWDLQVEAATRLSASGIENEAFGGISGGPVFCVASDRTSLSGIVKQGGRIFGVPRVIASSWDDVLHAIQNARNKDFGRGDGRET